MESVENHDDNSDGLWLIRGQTGWHDPLGQLHLNIDADSLRPDVGDTVTFTVGAGTLSGTGHGGTFAKRVFDVQLRASASPGLTLLSGAASGSTSFAKSTGIWTVGDMATSASESLTVTTTYTGNAALEESCLTVQLVGMNPPDAGSAPPRAPWRNNGTLCLGNGSPAVLRDNALDASEPSPLNLVEFYPCVGSTIPACAGSDGLELVTYADSASLDVNNIGRHTRNPSANRYLIQPESIVVHIPDPQGRKTSGGQTIWSTEGVIALRESQALISSGDWGKAREIVTATGLGGSSLPGTLTFKFPTLGSQYHYVLATTSDEANSGTFNTGSYLDLELESTSLGTYLVTMQISVTAHPTEGQLTDNGTYTLHYGPMAELELRDVTESSPLASSSQQAYTIAAANNGPDDAPAVQVTGLPTGLSAVASQGSYDPDTGIWNIGELESRETRPAQSKSETATLTLITEDVNPPPITATITNTQDYTVCIDSDGNDIAAASETACTGSWHTTKYYDHIHGNNTATITAKTGTGEGHPDAPSSLSIMGTPVGNILLWGAVAELNGFAVTHYEVERWASRWTPLADARGRVYFDMGGRSNADYRVRAVNNQKVGGPWSITGRPPDAPGNFTVALSDSGNGAVLSWTEPASPTPITGYVIDISDSTEGDSRTNDATVAASVTTWTHTGLGPGDVKFYRMQARNRDGVGEWTEWQSVGSGPGAPGNLQARPNGSSETVLTWSAAPSQDVPIYEYELEYSDTSASEGYQWTFLQTVLPHEGLRYVDNTVSPGMTRHYRMRAWTVGDQAAYGPWSNVARAATPAAGPSPPRDVTADYEVGNTENGILLTWEAPASGDASYYRIEHSTDGGATWELESSRHTATCDVGGTTKFCYTDRGLFSGSEHWYRVAGVNSSGVAGEWARSNSHMTQGEPTEAPGEPQNLRVTVSGRQATLAWDPPENDGGSPVTRYEYEVRTACAHNPSESCQVVKPTSSGTRTTATVTVPNVKGYYEFSVRALNAVGAGWWSQPASQYVNPQRTWRVSLSPSSLTVPEGGEATYRVRLTSDPGQPVMLSLWWDGDPDLGNNLPYQQFKWLLPTNYASRNPDIYLDPEFTSPWNTGVTITVAADDDADSENGTLEIDNTVYYVPCADLGNPAGCVDDPEDTGVTVWLTATERDNTP